MDKEELLTKFLENIKTELNPASFTAWFNDLKIFDLKSTSITFEVPMEIHKRMLGDNYYGLISKTLSNITNIDYDIDFILKEEITENINKTVSIEENIPNNDFKTNLDPNLSCRGHKSFSQSGGDGCRRSSRSYP